ncbi:MAG: hypothetical protein WCI42_05880 [Verrucomicrobiota bacterium]
MTLDSIRTSISAWAAQRGIQIVASERSLPPAELDMRPLLDATESGSAGPGLHVHIDAVTNGGPDADIGFWIPNSLKKGSWSAMAEDHDEIPLYWIPDFSDEASLIAFIDRTTNKFFLQHVYETALDEWLADNGHSYTVVEKTEFCGDAAALAERLGLHDWLFLEFQDAGGYDITLGISGKGGAATFLADEDGFLTFDQRGDGFKTGEDLTKWVASVISSKA